jgi:uncharacterized membrane protein YidH (DUF202 family)
MTRRHVGPSDPGLAGERTTLAWARIGLALLGLPAALGGYAASQGLAVAAVAAAFAAALGLWLLVSSLRVQRTQPDMLRREESVLGGHRVALTAASVVLLALAALLVVSPS